MPYINQESRKLLDSDIDWLVHQLKLVYKEIDGGKAGLLNYTITRLLLDTYDKDNYDSYNERIGVLEACKLEFYRKRVAPYEDQKEYENGGVS